MSTKFENLSNEFCIRYQNVKDHIRVACERSGRYREDIKLMLVTKTLPPARIREAAAYGHTLFGENKIQELDEKHEALLSLGLEWHFIGHLQSNKAKACVRLASVVESIDRMSLVRELDKHLQRNGKCLDILVQVNTSGEISKFGLNPEDTLPFLKEISRFKTLKVKGLMTLALFSSNEELVRPCFRKLRQLFHEAQQEAIEGIEMKELSMGMSSDYRWAIEEGATIVRVGQAIFGPRSLPDSHYWPERNV